MQIAWNAFGVKNSVHRNLSSASALHDATTDRRRPRFGKSECRPFSRAESHAIVFSFRRARRPGSKGALAGARAGEKRPPRKRFDLRSGDRRAIEPRRRDRSDQPGLAIPGRRRGDALSSQLGLLSLAHLEPREHSGSAARSCILRYCAHLRNLRSARSHRGAACRRRGIPYLLEPMGMFRPMVRNLALKRAYRRLFGRIALCAGRRGWWRHRVQEAKRADRRRNPPQKISVRRNGIELPQLSGAAGAFRRQYGRFRGKTFWCCFSAESLKRRVRNC